MNTVEIRILLGDEALTRFNTALNGHGGDVLLAIETAIQKVIGVDSADPNTEPTGVWVQPVD